MIPCRETTWERLLSVGFATLNATAKFGCIPAGYVTLPRSLAAFRRLYSYAIPSDSQAVAGASGSSPVSHLGNSGRLPAAPTATRYHLIRKPL